MKILFTHELFSPYIAGGGEIFCEAIVKEMIKSGIDVTVVAGAWDKSRFEYFEGIPIYRVNLSPFRYSFNIKGLFALKKLIKKIDPDLIHSNTYHAAIPSSIISRLHKCPIVLSVHSLFLESWFRYFNPITSSAYYLFEKFLFKFPFDKIVALDWGVFHNLCRLGLKDKTVMIPHPIDVNMFTPKRKPHAKIIIGTVGRLYGATKRTYLFVKLVERIQKKYDVRFLAVGKCDKILEQTLRDKGIGVIGEVPHSQVSDYYNQIDIFIGQGMSVKEAMACGCVAILNESTPLFLRYHKEEIENNLLFTGDILDNVTKLLENPSLMRNISRKGVKFIRENYSIDRIIPKTIKVYESVLGYF